MSSHPMNRPAPISVFSDQRRTKSTIWSRVSCGTQTPIRVPQSLFLKLRAPPSVRPEPRLSSGSSSPGTRFAPARRSDCLASSARRQMPRSRRTPSASGRRPWAETQLIAELRDRLLVQQMPPQDGDFLFRRVVLPLLLHAFSPLPYRENASSISRFPAEPEHLGGSACCGYDWNRLVLITEPHATFGQPLAGTHSVAEASTDGGAVVSRMINSGVTAIVFG